MARYMYTWYNSIDLFYAVVIHIWIRCNVEYTARVIAIANDLMTIILVMMNWNPCEKKAHTRNLNMQIVDIHISNSPCSTFISEIPYFW